MHVFCSIFDSVSDFLALKQINRIEQLSNCLNSGGKIYDFMSAIKVEMEKGLISKHEVLEIITAYLTNPYIIKQAQRQWNEYGPDMGLNWYYDNLERNVLWRLLSLFPEWVHLSEMLPLIPKDVCIEGLNNVACELIEGKHWNVLASLFDRSDVKETDLRNSLYKECMRAVSKSERNRFFGIEKYNAVQLLCSLSSKEWDDIYEKIKEYYSE